MPNYYCVFNMATATCIVGVASWTELCLAINRVFAICRPHYYSRISSRGIIRRLLLFPWLIVLLVVVPGVFGLGGFFTVIDINQCVYVSTGRLGDFFAAMALLVLMTLSGMCCAVILAKSVMTQPHRRVTGNVSGDQEGTPARHVSDVHAHRRMEIALVLFTSFLVGAACDLPFIVMLMRFGHLFVEYPLLTVWIRFLIDAQYTISPVWIIRFTEVNIKSIILNFSWLQCSWFAVHNDLA